ncbi:ATP-binding cassette domain-containing protein [Corynebacterium lowii]|uniref:Putative HMP/thiamine import ATP-binding protein YkoD n=1 Tax=Corynebacterium lowii TaxID=1544413 RepID=A0A0Q0YVI1_9CORY|nr:ATP-binding cassette domain-containing protein [Corynebacterium lowii]KQB86326.1 putative HMP/thiamine import ATP-binding protein YkoD [Corynebacterium lowii]MDP9850811.1 energy-coupling factor transport system ATP-binding protein [Corynebacterium lowii]
MNTQEIAAELLGEYLRPGEIVQVVGDSGSGRSTIGRRVARAHDGAMMVTQDAEGALSGLRDTVCEEVAFGLEQRGVPPQAMRERVAQILGQLRLEALAEAAPGELSGGQTRRLAIASVAVLAPDILILDSPCAGLDADSAGAVISLCAHVARRGGSVLVVGYAPVPGLSGTVLWWDGERLNKEAPQRHHDLPAPVFPRTESTIFSGVTATRGKDFHCGPETITVRCGGVTWLRGPNGTGKTSLLRALAGLDGAAAPEHPVALALQRSEDQVIDSRTAAMAGGEQVCRKWGLDPEAHPLDLCASDLRCAQVLGAGELHRRVLALDEPEVGCDFLGRQRLHQIVASYLAAGTGVVMTCHEQTFMAEVSRYARVDIHDLGTANS